MGPEPGSGAAPLRELKPGERPEGASWYSLVPLGEGPCARVGQNTLYLPPQDASSQKGNVLIVGGANPSGSFSDSYFIDLDTHGWTAPTWSGLSPRYEHATFIPESQPTTLWVYGGASETGNRNCVQVLDLRTGTWESPEVTGTPPSPRTFHTSSAAIGDRLYVFGGGEKGVDPVLDQKLHVFDSATLSWSQPQVRGRPPAARHGHVMVAVQNRLFLHGGLAGSTLYDDLFSIDTTDMEWVAMAATGSVPQGRAAHSAAAFRDHLYIFGGMDPTGALDTMYKYHIEKNHWTRVEFKSPSPPGRLDHSMCVIPWKVSAGSATAGGAQGQKEATGSSSGGCPEEGLLHLCLIFGGMSMKGEIYRDVAVSLLV
ncbi:rab9 effector protein with kelch motifs isoform X2 [Varanus komodoensis]|uniref:Rab9 effector protein with kelch motifs n=1 Tax=Varanus komodoensis TaxID=61221 RepID=A0A8D2KR91_VARKO|nr:rab9 effector protein with kelch motifs isoform X2 [Varanus komodoensis]